MIAVAHRIVIVVGDNFTVSEDNRSPIGIIPSVIKNSLSEFQYAFNLSVRIKKSESINKVRSYGEYLKARCLLVLIKSIC